MLSRVARLAIGWGCLRLAEGRDSTSAVEACVARGAYADSCLGCRVDGCTLTCASCDKGAGLGGNRDVSFDLRQCTELENRGGALACCEDCGVPAPPPLAAVEACPSPCTAERPEDLVEVLAGTDTRTGSDNSNGNTLPQVKRPWGFNDWVPETAGSAGAWWFRRQDTSFEGMRCTHQPSPWIRDYGYFTIQPHVAVSPSTLSYSSDDATFRPYLFSASLQEEGHGETKFELTPTNHAAVLRATFPTGSGKGHVTLAVKNGQVSLSNGVLSGYTTDHSGGTPSGWKMYFVMKALSNSTLAIQSEEAWPQTSGTLSFDREAGAATLAVATSLISVQQAELSLDREVGGRGFDAVRAEGQEEWHSKLSTVAVEARDSERLRVFYTNAWKGMLFPRFLTEVDGSGNEVHMSPYTGKIESGKLAADSGFWDAYRSVYALHSIAHTEVLGALMDGWTHAYDEAGWLPTWPSPGQRGSMVGTMGDVAVADAIVKSKWGYVSGFDVDKAYDMIRKDAYVPKQGLFGRTGLNDYISKGYVPYDASDESTSMTLNHYIADAAIANAAKILGHDQDHDELVERSLRYPVTFNNDSMFFQPMDAEGNFVSGFDPLAWKDGFTESGPWQYRFYVPHDVEGLKSLYKGQLCDLLDQEMNTFSGDAFHVGGYGHAIHEETELAKIHFEFGYYAHNNQPVHHLLYVAKKAGCEAVADAGLRKTMELLYRMQGWSGDEDNGEMANWYVLSALGLYPLEQATDELVLGSPDVVAATVQLPGGKTLRVSTDGQSKTAVHVQSVTWTPSSGGQQRQTSGNVIKYTEIMEGGTLHFVMGNEPKSVGAIVV